MRRSILKREAQEAGPTELTDDAMREIIEFTTSARIV